MIDGDYHSLGADTVTRLGRLFADRRVGGPLDGATPAQLELARHLERRGIVPRPPLQVTDSDIAAVLASAPRVDFSRITGDPIVGGKRTA